MTNSSGKAKSLEKVKTDAEIRIDKLEKELNDAKKELKGYKSIEKQREENKIVPNENDTVTSDDYIEVISMCPTILTLTTEPKGRGNHYTWVNFGDIRQIVYSDWQKILTNHGSGLYTDFIRKGYVYINNPAAVKKSGLQEVYKQLLPPEKMNEVLECNEKTSAQLFSSTIKDQQLNICKILIDRMANGKEYDLNVIDKLSRISGIKLLEMAGEAKSYLDMKLKTEIE